MLDKIKIIFKNKEFSLLLENFFSLSILKLISSVVPFIAVPYLIRVLNFSNYGIIIFGLSIVTYFINISIYGFRISGARDIARNSKNIKYLCQKTGLIFSTQLVVLAALTFIYLLCLLYIPRLRDQLLTFSLFIPYMWGETLFPSWFFQGIQKMKYITVVSSFVKVFFTLCVFLLIKEDTDYWIYPIILSSGSVIALFFTFIVMFQLRIYPQLTLNFTQIKRELTDNFTLFLNSVTPMLFANTTTVIMGFILPTNHLGIYDAIRKIPTIISVLMQVVSQTVFPFFSRRFDKFKEMEIYLIMFNLAIILLPYISYKLFFYIFAIPDTTENILILTALIIGLLGITLSNIYGINYLIVIKRESYVLKATIISSLVGFFLSYPLVRIWGVLGGAINIAASQLLLGIITYIYYLRVSNEK